MVDSQGVILCVLLGVLLLGLLAEWLHARRVARVAGLAFGPRRRPRWFARWAGWVRILSLLGLSWGLLTLYFLPAKVHAFQGGDQDRERHLVILLDVSPSMRLEDAGPMGKQSRRQRCQDIVAAFQQRVSTDQYRISIFAFFNGVKPVVIDTRDGELVQHILRDLPLYQAFQPGKTSLYEGLKSVAATARRWGPKSTTLLVLTDGDTQPLQGVPDLPRSIANVLLVGVGDSRSGSFIAGRQSRQDAGQLRQLAVRLRGEYFDGNVKHVPTKLLLKMQANMNDASFVKMGLREMALIAVGIGGLVYAILPWVLHYFGTGWQPGVPTGQRSQVTTNERQPARASEPWSDTWQREDRELQPAQSPSVPTGRQMQNQSVFP